MKKNVGQIEFKVNWDERISWYKDIPGENISIELESFQKLRNFLIRNDSGSLLISGERGVGKTTTVINAIRSCEKDGYIFPIYLNSIHLESFGEEQIDGIFRMVKLLQLLIRTLAIEVSKKTQIPYELHKLLRDCEATRISISETTLAGSKFKSNVGMNANAGGNAKILSFAQIGAKLETGVNAETAFDESSNSIWEKTGLSLEDLVDRFNKVIKILERKDILSKEIYKSRTLSVKLFNREFKLLALSPEISKKAKKIVFVIDELDVYDGDGASNIRPKDILNTIKKFKNLFTLSSAHFVFIVGKNTYFDSKIDPYRTLFTDRIFLSTPDGEYLSKYLDSMIVGELSNEMYEEWNEWKWYLISISRHNLYDLITLVNSYTNYVHEENRLVINLPEKTPTEKVIASFHYLLNAIFVYYRQSSILEHYNDTLFNELYEIEDSFRRYLLNNRNIITLKINETGDIHVNQTLIEAKIALYSTLFSFANIKAPLMVKDNPIDVPWAEIRQALEFSRVQKGITSPITIIERNFMKNLNELLSKLDKMFGSYLDISVNAKNLKIVLKKLIKELEISINEIDIDTVLAVYEQIRNVPVDKRDWDFISEGMQSLTAVSSAFGRFEQFGKKFIVKADWGLNTIDYHKINLGAEASHGNKLLSRLSVMLPKIKGNSIEITAKVKLSPGSLVNFIFYNVYDVNDINCEYYMARLDSRDSAFGNCILFKPKGASWDKVPDSTFQRSNTPSDVYSTVQIKLENGYLNLQKKIGKNLILISRTKYNGICTMFGFGNELGPVEIIIHSINFKKRSHLLKTKND